MMLLALSAALLVALPAASQGVPASIEIDLLFPRNETYAPTAYFPIVFALRNAKLAWPLGTHIFYTVEPWDNNGGTDSPGKDLASGNSLGKNFSTGFTQGDAPADPFIWTTSTNLLNTSAATGFVVRWYASMYRNCSGPEAVAGSTSPTRSVFFTTSKNAAVPDVRAAVEKCAVGNVTFGVDKVEKGCSSLSTETPPADTCGLELFGGMIAESVSSSMLALANCKSGVWQNISKPCSGSLSLFGKQEGGHWMLASAVLLASLLAIL